MSSSKSSPTNTTATTTNASETNLAATNTQGVTLLGSSGNTLTSNTNNYSVTTDLGAVQAGTTLGQLAIAANSGLSESIATQSSDFANHSLDVLSKTQTQSANLVSDVLSQGLGFLTSNEQQVVDLARENQQANNAQLGNVATTLANIAQANDTTAASQSTAFAQSILKYAAIALLGVGALIVFYAAVKK